jgi:putative endopeptidase
MNHHLVRTLAAVLFAAGAAWAAGPTSGIDQANFDPAVRPQDDLFRAVNGTWLARTAIPADRSNYGAFTVLVDNSEKDMRAIIEESANARNPGSEEQKVGDLYASFMDEARADQLGVRPIAPLLASVDAIKTKADFARTLGAFTPLGIPGAFRAFVNTDGKNSDQYIIYLVQGGIGLPERDYYLDPKFAEKLALYGQHIERMLTLARVPDAKARAADVLQFETRLATAHWTKEDSRDSTRTYNKRSRTELSGEAPGFDWNLYFDAAGAGGAKEFIVSQPSYFAALAKAADSVPLATWKAWLAWKVINRSAAVLSREFADADFAFYGTVLNGTPENRPRWKRAIDSVEGGLGEVVGKIYVGKHFPPEAKARMDALVGNLIEAYRAGIQNLEWMSQETRQKALAKLGTFNPKIGYPRKWRDYSSLRITRDDLAGNLQRVSEFNWRRNLAKLGKPIDRD